MQRVQEHGLGCSFLYGITENQMEKKMEYEMDPGIIGGSIGLVNVGKLKYLHITTSIILELRWTGITWDISAIAQGHRRMLLGVSRTLEAEIQIP